jgi:hypothetical protein
LDSNFPAFKPLALVHGVVLHHLGVSLNRPWVAPARAARFVLAPVAKRDDVAKHLFIARVNR